MKGATAFGAMISYVLGISIHAPMKGATALSTKSTIVTIYFNPRTREGCDLVLTQTVCQLKLFQSTHPWRVRLEETIWAENRLKISIHAPVKGATTGLSKIMLILLLFQSTHPWRVRRTGSHRQCKHQEFQSTHPWRVRREFYLVYHLCYISISIHAPLKGATKTLLSNIKDFFNFNPRTPEGCDYLQGCDPKEVIMISIHAPLKGATSS